MVAYGWNRTNLIAYLERRYKQIKDKAHGSVSDAPVVYSLTPATGSHTGGTNVVIAGRNLTGATAVLFGATAAASFTIDSDDQITAVSPAVAASTVAVTVTTPANSVVGPNFIFT